MDYMTTRRECRYAGKCGACQTLNLTYERELSMKMKKEITLLGKFGHVEEILSMDCPLRYRNKVQYLFRWDRGRVRYGLYRSSDGGLVTVDDCMMEDKNAAAVCHTVRRMIDKYKITVFDGVEDADDSLTYRLNLAEYVRGQYYSVSLAETFDK